MGRPKCACFSILACTGGGDGGDGGDGGGDDDVEESNSLSDKCWCTFWRRSAKLRVSRSSVISEPASVSPNKEKSDLTTDNACSPHYCSVPEKLVEEKKPDETVLLAPAEAEFKETKLVITDASGTPNDQNNDDLAATVLQAGIRRYLARIELKKLKSVVMIQAVARGYLARRVAVGTLRCTLAIIRTQRLVRAYQAHQLVEKLAAKEDKVERSSCKEPSKAYSPTEIFHSNGFARKIMEAASRTKTVHLKCDPSIQNSAWEWLERWTAVASSNLGKQQEKDVNHHYVGQDDSTELADSKAVDLVPCGVVAMSWDSKIAPSEQAATIDSEGLVTNRSCEAADVQASEYAPDNSSVKDNLEIQSSMSEASTIIENNHVNTETITVDSFSDFANAITEPIHHTSYTDSEPYNDNLKDSMDMGADSEPLGENLTVSEPSYSESQDNVSKSEELIVHSEADASTKNSEITYSESIVSHDPRAQIVSSEDSMDMGADSEPYNDNLKDSMDMGADSVPLGENLTVSEPSYSESQDNVSKSEELIVHSEADASTKNSEITYSESIVSHDSRAQIVSSEDATNNSTNNLISSKLYLADRSETEAEEVSLEIKDFEKGDEEINGEAEKETNQESKHTGTEDSSYDFEVDQLQRLEEGHGDSAGLTTAVGELQIDQQLTEATPLKFLPQAGASTDPEVQSSPKGTPISHTTVAESQGTPSSGISVNSKTGKKDKTTHTQRQRSHTLIKRALSSPKNDSGGTSTAENLPKTIKNTKKISSLGVEKRGHGDHEPRVSDRASLPGYMKTTESARAKVHGNSSPKSSPDVHDDDINKRHSLPAGDGKQDSSPGTERSKSQAQKNSKSTSTNSPQVSSERRWQI